MVRVSPRPFRDLFETFSRPSFPIKCIFHPTWTLKQPKILFMFKVKYVDYIMMLVGLDLNLIVSLFQHKCEVSETVSTTTLVKEFHLLFTQTQHMLMHFDSQVYTGALPVFRHGIYILKRLTFCGSSLKRLPNSLVIFIKYVNSM